MEKYLWLGGDEGDVSQVDTYDSKDEMFQAVQKYLVYYYTNLLEGDSDDDDLIGRATRATSLEELIKTAEGFFWGENGSKVFNFVKVTDEETIIL